METIVTLLIGALATFFLFFKRGDSESEFEQKLADRAEELKKESDKIDDQLKEKVKNLNDQEVVDYWKKHE